MRRKDAQKQLGRTFLIARFIHFNQNFRFEVRKCLDVEWITTCPDGLVSFNSQSELGNHYFYRLSLNRFKSCHILKTALLEMYVVAYETSS